MRISDWSSDVCSSDLDAAVLRHQVDAERIAVAERLVEIGGGAALLVGAQRQRRGVVVALEGLLGGQVDRAAGRGAAVVGAGRALGDFDLLRSEEHTSELQSLMRISYAVFCLKKKT